MESLWSELRSAARRLARRPGFAAVAVGTLALGIGGATAIFSIADAVILRPLPFPDPERMEVAWPRDRRSPDLHVLSYKTYQYWRDQIHGFEGLAGLAETNWGWTLTGRGEPVELMGRLVTADFFSVMGVRPALGRWLVNTDDQIGAGPVVVVSHALWRERFSEDPAVVGQSLVLGGQVRTVVGVMPKGFAYPQGGQLWLPLVPAPARDGRPARAWGEREPAGARALRGKPAPVDSRRSGRPAGRQDRCPVARHPVARGCAASS